MNTTLLVKRVFNRVMSSKKGILKREIEDDGETKPAKKPVSGHWALGLLNSMEDPNQKVEEDDLTVVISDKYPKAEIHYLVIPKEDIPSLKELDKSHKSLLKHMHQVGERLAAAQPNREFKIGYHAHASMSRLHLHVISDDFNSPALKTKKHWNSYTTEFFLPYSDVYKDLKTNGNVTLKSENEVKTLLGLGLKCHKCKFESTTIPNLKKHVLTHFQT